MLVVVDGFVVARDDDDGFFRRAVHLDSVVVVVDDFVEGK